MMFRNQLKRGHGVLHRGDRCLFRFVDAWYLGSFKNDGDVHWNHMLLMQTSMNNGGDVPCMEEFIVTTRDSREIVFKAMMREPLEGQLMLC